MLFESSRRARRFLPIPIIDDTLIRRCRTLSIMLSNSLPPINSDAHGLCYPVANHKSPHETSNEIQTERKKDLSGGKSLSKAEFRDGSLNQ